MVQGQVDAERGTWDVFPKAQCLQSSQAVAGPLGPAKSGYLAFALEPKELTLQATFVTLSSLPSPGTS